MPKTSFLVVRPARMLLAVLSMAVISGCATSYPSGSASQQQRYVLNDDSAKPILDERVNGFLDQTPAGGVISVANSPWGDNVEIVADESYLAASGRECRRLQVIGMSGEARRALVCKASSEEWVNQRVITQTAEGRL
ncbi:MULTISPECIES: DVU3141 family protein [Halomonas]|uniref:DVU3141 family protein n=1 Tax=Halomonas TaxID=2745 RepID=UPI001866B5EC|nr:DVU3141 family protein [Halomonas citrativorans]